jgi:hypothetical protein
MKKLLLLLSFCILHFTFCNLNSLKAQNLVNNPSFEDYSTCPINSNQVQYSTEWDNFSGSPDYFNSCSINPDFSVPNNWGGYQQAAIGNAYCAFSPYGSPIFGFHNEREFIGGHLSALLNIGIKYYVSFKVSLSLDSAIDVNCASNKIGAMFSTIPYSWNNPTPITNNPQVYTDSIIIDTINWTRIFGSFIADSNYQYIIIGNFFTDSNTDTLIMNSNYYCNSYYYLDDVCVSADSLTCNPPDAIIDNKLNENIEIFPSPANSVLHIATENINNYSLKIYNITGEMVLQAGKLYGDSDIDIAAFPKGVYIIQIVAADKLFNKKLIVQ